MTTQSKPLRPRVLICDDNPLIQIQFRAILQNHFELIAVTTGKQAIDHLQKHTVNLVILDVHLSHPLEGLDLIPRILEIDPEASIIMSSVSTDFANVRRAMRQGAVDYIPKQAALNRPTDPPPDRDLLLTIQRCLERRQLLARQSQQDFETHSGQRQHVLIGDHPSIIELRRLIDKLRVSDAHVLITGETGTGKEVVARLLRGSLPQGGLAPFVAIDSSTIQSSMAESILFGHEKGAFTGAQSMVKGIFEEANQGTLYFDEVANMPLGIQAKLLRVIQEKEVTRLGSARVIPLSFRLICATNEDLEKRVAQGTFKADLYQRINVIPVHIPPLRERRTDLPLLIEHFLFKNARGTPTRRLSSTAFEALLDYNWPGNVRELANVLQYGATMSEDLDIELSHLPLKFKGQALTTPPGPEVPTVPPNLSFYDRMEQFEAEFLRMEHARHQGSLLELARKLGMDRSHLHAKLKRYNIRSGLKT